MHDWRLNGFPLGSKGVWACAWLHSARLAPRLLDSAQRLQIPTVARSSAECLASASAASSLQMSQAIAMAALVKCTLLAATAAGNEHLAAGNCYVDPGRLSPMTTSTPL